jgi:uncharacterized protein YfdQ (DUF2303 family)
MSNLSPSTAPASAPLDRQAINTQVIAELAKASVPRYEVLDLKVSGLAPRIIFPNNGNIVNLEGTLLAPLRKRGSAALVDADSFATYIQQHRTAGTALYGDANETGGGFVALLDAPPPNAGDAVQLPTWCEHTATQKLEPTPEWKRWLGKSGVDLDQKTFAEFIEDNAQDIIVPEGDAGKGFPTQQDLLSVASTLQIKTDVRFASSVKLQNGQVQLGYTEQIEAGHGAEGKMLIPERFGLAIAPFRGTPKYLVVARLRYRGTGGKAIFRYEIERPHKIVESAFNDVRMVIEKATKLKVLVGSITPQARPNV